MKNKEAIKRERAKLEKKLTFRHQDLHDGNITVKLDISASPPIPIECCTG